MSGSRELRQVIDDIGRASFEARRGDRGIPERFDDALWRTLEDTGFARLTTESGARPADLAVTLEVLARHAAAVPIAETGLAAWLGERAGIELPASGPLTIAFGAGFGKALVPWSRACAAVIAAVDTDEGLAVGVLADPEIGPDVVHGHNLAGEPRDRVDVGVSGAAVLDAGVGQELRRRGAWARCIQILGALDAALALTVAHTRERVQFGRPLSAFQAVQHSLAAMSGDIERARAATNLAIAAADDHGFAAAETDYAVTVAKVAVGRAVEPVTTTAHQLHGAIGVTAEYPLWLATMRAQSWVTEFGSTGHYARALGRAALAAQDPWELIIGSQV